MSSAAQPILLCGLGRVGTRALELLRRLGEPVSVLTLQAPSPAAEALLADVPVEVGDARDDRRLLAAGLKECRALLALTDQDLVNIEIVVDARRHRPDLPVVARLFDRRLARRLEGALAVRRASAVSALAAPAFAAAAAHAEEVHVAFRAAGEGWLLGRLPVSAGGPLDGLAGDSLPGGLPILEVETAAGRARPAGEPLAAGDRILVAAPRPEFERLSPPVATETAVAPPPPLPSLAARVWQAAPRSLRVTLALLAALLAVGTGMFHFGLGISFLDAAYYLVTTVTTTGYGDITPLHASAWVKVAACAVMVIGAFAMAVLTSLLTDVLLGERFGRLLGRPATPPSGHVIVVGLGNLGYRVVDELLGGGMPVVAVERNPAADLVAAARGRASVVEGDGRAKAILREAGVERAVAVVAATGDDAANLGVALLARELSPSVRTVVRLFDPGFAGKLELTGTVDRALSSSRLAAPTFVASALEPGVLAATWTGRALHAVVERPAGNWTGRRPDELASESVRLLRRDGSDAIRADETLIAVVSRPAVASDDRSGSTTGPVSGPQKIGR